MGITLEELKSYLRISHAIDDNFITSLIAEAKFYIKNKTGVDYSDADLTYNQLIRFLVQHNYDNRASISDKAVVEIPYTIDALLTDIKLRGALSE